MPRLVETESGQEFVRLSARVGANPMLVQGGGGNTSIKDDGEMWVKASGTWLADAGRREIFVRVDLGRMRDEVARGIEPDFSSPTTANAGLRPSIETLLHVVLPHRVIAHYHSVNGIAVAVRRGAPALLSALLSGLRWAWVRYSRPGLPLALEVQKLPMSAPDVLVLANHGLIVCGTTPTEVWSLIGEVERRLEQPVRPSPDPDLRALELLAAGTRYAPAMQRELHAIATDPVSLQIARTGSLYPDHVVFLGSGIGVLEDDAGPGETLERLGKANVALVAVPGKGLLVHRSLKPGQQQMANCLALVLPRVPSGTPVEYLTVEQEAELLNWQAEAYRKAMDA